ncbi:hypothetical protein HYR54_00790, partial [Candidatus Acetothermia bacterium]|nr:hypothetical protein [Candidatus Acetothermia bacterium]
RSHFTQLHSRELLLTGDEKIHIKIEGTFLALHTPILLFINSTAKVLKEKKNVKYRFVDNVKIYEFIEQLHMLPRNNPITPFSSSAEICNYLCAQWAGLFQRFLQEQKRLAEIKVLDEMKGIAETLRQLGTFLTAERRNKDDAINSILLLNHPAFRAFAKATGTRYRVVFTNTSELNEWLKARNWLPVNKDNFDEDSVAEWHKENENKYLKLTHSIFLSDGRLKPLTDADWKETWVQVKDIQTQEPPDEEVPF